MSANPSSSNPNADNFSIGDLDPATRLVHGGTLRSQFGETSEALFLTQGFVYDSAEQAEARFLGTSPGFQYSRFANPTLAMLEERLRLLEGAEDVRVTATGMAAVTTAILSKLNTGDHIVAARAMFGSCRYIVEVLCPRFGIEFTLIDGRDTQAWANALKPNTKMFFFETPSNPLLDLVDIAAVSNIAHAADVVVVVDNVFATPLLQHPLKLGADVVVYSATKHIDGQGRCLGGAILGSKKFIKDHVHDFIRQTGPSLSPFNAWVLLKGLETLPIRVEAQTRSAARVADFVAEHKASARVWYPFRKDFPQAELARKQMSGGGTIVAFDVKGGKREAFAAINALRIVKISNNLGDAKSLITHPATTTHQRLTPEARAELGITDATIRLSIGLESTDDLIRDMDRALGAAVVG